jgi:hypothetical protein
MRHETEHASIARSRLTDGGRRNEGLAALVDALAEHIQEVEDAYWQLFEERRLAVAVGAQLDVLGALVGQPRNAFGDVDYRGHISARILANSSNGTAEELLAIVRSIVPGPTTLTLTDAYPAAFVLHAGVSNLSAALVPIIVGMIRSARQAGVRGIFEFMSGTTDADSFTFDGGGGLGFGDATTPATGGGLAGALT